MSDKELLIQELRKGIAEIKEAYKATLIAGGFFPQWAWLTMQESGEDWEVK